MELCDDDNESEVVLDAELTSADQHELSCTCSLRAIIEFNRLFEAHSMSNQWNHIQHLLIHIFSGPSSKKKKYHQVNENSNFESVAMIELELDENDMGKTIKYSPNSEDGMECSNELNLSLNI